MVNPGDWARGLLRPRLDVFATRARAGTSFVGMVSIRLTTTADRVLRAGLTLAGAALAIAGSILLPHHASTTLAIGLVALVGAVRIARMATTVMADAPLARAAVRAALTEGREIAAQRWRIDGVAAVELGKELTRLQSLWLPGYPAQSRELDRARATMIANEASARLTPYFGDMSAAEHHAWLATPRSAELPEEPDHRAEYHADGAEWPSLSALEPGPTWPTVPRGDHS